jgi:hypothetical protein
MHYALIPAGGVRPEQVMGGMQMPQPLSLEKSQMCLPLQSWKVMHLTRKRSWCESSQNLKKRGVTFIYAAGKSDTFFLQLHHTFLYTL